MPYKYFKILVLTTLLFLEVAPAALLADNSDAPKLKVVVLDAGHGGKDPGCISKNRKLYEKTVTLDLVKSLGAKISAAYPDVKVVYTRTTDRYITLNDRANIANSNHANLFISIHVNSATSTSARGFSSHVLGPSRDKNRDLFSSNLDLVRRENSVILLEEDYDTKYQGFDPNDPESFIFFNLMQNAFYEQSLLFATELDKEFRKGPITKSRGVSQDPFFVLWKTSMPAVLVEVGFITNTTDLSHLSSSYSRGKMADALFRAFKNFKAKYDGSVDYDDHGYTNSTPVEKIEEEKVEESKTVYGTQIFVLSKKLSPDDKVFKGNKPMIIKSGNIYKYVIGLSNDVKSAKAKSLSLKRSFKGSYLVKIENNVVSVYK